MGGRGVEMGGGYPREIYLIQRGKELLKSCIVGFLARCKAAAEEEGGKKERRAGEKGRDGGGGPGEKESTRQR